MGRARGMTAAVLGFGRRREATTSGSRHEDVETLIAEAQAASEARMAGRIAELEAALASTITIHQSEDVAPAAKAARTPKVPKPRRLSIAPGTMSGANLEQLLKMRGITGSELARRAGLLTPAVYNALKEKGIPTPHSRELMRNALEAMPVLWVPAKRGKLIVTEDLQLVEVPVEMPVEVPPAAKTLTPTPEPTPTPTPTPTPAQLATPLPERVVLAAAYGQGVRAARHRAGMTCREVEGLAGLGMGTLAKIERGQTYPRLATKARIDAVVQALPVLVPGGQAHHRVRAPRAPSKKKDAQKYGLWLREQRLAAGMTQQAVEEAAHIAARSLCMYENGKFLPKKPTRVRIEAALGGKTVSAPAARPTSEYGRWLQEQRLARGLSQDALQKAAGIDQSTISKYECGIRHPRNNTEARINAALTGAPAPAPAAKPSRSEYGRWLQEQRLARGLSQYQLAAAAGIDQSNISKYERGIKHPRNNTEARIYAALTGTPAPTPAPVPATPKMAEVAAATPPPEPPTEPQLTLVQRATLAAGITASGMGERPIPHGIVASAAAVQASERKREVAVRALGDGEKLLRLRQAKGLSQLALGERTGIHQTMISAYETGRSKPPQERLALLLAALA